MSCTSPCVHLSCELRRRIRWGLFRRRTPCKLWVPSLQDIAYCQPLDIKATKWDILEVFFIDVHFVAVATPAALALPAGGRASLLGVAGSAEELHVVGDDVHLGALGAVLSLPGTVLQASLDEYGVALLLVVGDGLAELAPRTYVEEVHLLVSGAHPVDREPERTHRYPVAREPEFRISRKVSREYDAVETDHLKPPLLGPLGLTLQEYLRSSSA